MPPAPGRFSTTTGETEHFRERLGHQACSDIGAAAGAETDHQADGAASASPDASWAGAAPTAMPEIAIIANATRRPGNDVMAS